MRTPAAQLVCHVLLAETDGGMVLVDPGFGLDDIAEPAKRLGSTRRLLRACFTPATRSTTALFSTGRSSRSCCGPWRNMIAFDRGEVRRKHERLAELHAGPNASVSIVNARDPTPLHQHE